MNVTNIMENHSGVQELKTLNNNRQFKINSKFQKNSSPEVFGLDSYHAASSEISQKIALNESYTISNDFYERKQLSLIWEGNSELTKSLDSNNFSFLSSASSLNSNIMYHAIKSTSISNQVNDISCPNSQRKEESDLEDSDDSLGILPIAVLEDMTLLDSLIPDINKNTNLNTTIDNVDKGQFMVDSKVLPNSTLHEMLSPISIKPNVSFSCDQSEESPVQNVEILPKFASTPKHEPNFLDLSSEMVDTPTHNLSSEFHLGTCASEKERHAELHLKGEIHIQANLYSLKSLSESVEGIKTQQGTESVAENILNVTSTYPNEHEQSYNALCFENRYRVPEKLNETIDVLNTTYEKQLDKSTVSTLNLSFSKEKSRSRSFQRNNFGKSVGCFGSSNIKIDINKKYIQRNSLTNCVNISNDFPKKKIMKFSHSKTLSFKCPIKTKPSKISVGNQKNLDLNSDINKSNNKIFMHSALKSESSNHKIADVESFAKVKLQEKLLNETISLSPDNQSSSVMVDHENIEGFNLTANLNEKISRHSTLNYDLPHQNTEVNLVHKVKLPENQEKLLNETIRLSPPSFEGKTVVKKPRNSINFPHFRKNPLEYCEKLLHGKNNIAHENYTMPLKQKGKRSSLPITQNKISQVNYTTMFNRNLKPSGAGAVAVNEKNNIARLHEKHSSEKNTSTVPLSELNYNCSGKQHSTIPAFKPVYVTKKRANHIPISRKSQREEYTTRKANLNDTIILPGPENAFKQNTEALKPVYVTKKGANHIPISRKSQSEECASRKVNLNDTIILPAPQNDFKQNVEALKYRNTSIPVSKIPSVQICKMAQVKTGDNILTSSLQSSSEQVTREQSSQRMIPRSISSIHKIKNSQYNFR